MMPIIRPISSPTEVETAYAAEVRYFRELEADAKARRRRDAVRRAVTRLGAVIPMGGREARRRYAPG